MIQVEHLIKRYGSASVPAVNDLSFQLEGSGVYGLLGPNGAGKSTTMNILTGCLSLTSGKVSVNGFDIYEAPEKAKRQIGYLPEQPPLYPAETPDEYLRFVGEAKGLRGKALKAEIDLVVKETGLTGVRGRLISSLSKGYKQRVGIAQALLGNPDIIVLDEPTVGLDPIQIIEIRDLIRNLGRSHTVIFSSHILSEVQAICEKVLIIAGGKLVAFDTPDNLERLLAGSGGIRLGLLGEREKAEEILSALAAEPAAPAEAAEAAGVESEASEAPEASENASSSFRFTCRGEEEGGLFFDIETEERDMRALSVRIFRAFAAADIPIFELKSSRASLEDVFLELTGESGKKENTPQKKAAEAPEERAEETAAPADESAPEEGAAESEAEA